MSVQDDDGDEITCSVLTCYMNSVVVTIEMPKHITFNIQQIIAL